MAFGLFTNKTYFFDNAQAQRSPLQYVCAIIWHSIGYNIVNVANQLFFAYQGIASKLQVFVLPPTESTKAVDFICALKKKQEVWQKMMTALARS